MFSLAVFIRWSNISHVSSSPAPSSMCGYVCVSHSLSLLFIQCLVSLSHYLFFPYQHTLVSYILYYRDKFHSSPFAFTLSVNNPSLYYRLLVSYKNNHFLHSPHKWYIIFYLSISTFLPQIFMENLLNGILNHSPFFLQQPLCLLFITPTFRYTFHQFLVRSHHIYLQYTTYRFPPVCLLFYSFRLFSSSLLCYNCCNERTGLDCHILPCPWRYFLGRSAFRVLNLFFEGYNVLMSSLLFTLAVVLSLDP